VSQTTLILTNHQTSTVHLKGANFTIRYLIGQPNQSRMTLAVNRHCEIDECVACYAEQVIQVLLDERHVF
jgi:hypothetical protein